MHNFHVSLRIVAATAAFAIFPSAVATAQTGPTVPGQDEFTRLATAKLTERFGKLFSQAPTRYVKCSSRDYAADRYYGPQQTCRFEFGTRRTRRAGNVGFQYDRSGPEDVLVSTTTTDGRYDPRGRRCAIPPGKRTGNGWSVTSLRSPGKYRLGACRDGIAVVDQVRHAGTRTRLPSHLATVRLGATAGYPALDLWRCNLRRGRATTIVECRTDVGDRMTAILHRD